MIFEYESMVEEFMEMGNQFVCSTTTNSKSNVYKISTQYPPNWQTALGYITINPEKSPNIIYKWTLKFTCSSIDPRMTVGIVEYHPDFKINTSDDKWLWNAGDTNGIHYSWIYWKGCWTDSNDRNCVCSDATNDNQPTMYTNNVGNTLTMIVDCVTKQVSWTINNDENISRCTNIDISKMYQLAVCLADGQIEITDFSLSSNSTPTHVP